MKKTYKDYLFEVKGIRDKSWWDMDTDERNKYKFEATGNMLDDLSARISKLESQPDRPAFYTDKEIEDRIEEVDKAIEAMEEEEEFPGVNERDKRLFQDLQKIRYNKAKEKAEDEECEKWEYMSHRGEIGLPVLNFAGSLGWEVCEIISWDEGGIQQYETWFKRKI